MFTETIFAIVVVLFVGLIVGGAGMHLFHTYKKEAVTKEGQDNETIILIALMLVLRCKYRESKDVIQELLAPGADISTINRSRVKLIVSRLDLIKSNQI